jgi:L-fuconate dehydratase
VHLAQASLTNACFDLWAKSRGVPLWRLLLDLDPARIVDLLDLSYLEEVLTRDEAETMLLNEAGSRPDRENILRSGYPGYDTSWVDSSTKTSK